jgi:hypothetical protein
MYIRIGMMSIPNADHVNSLLSAAFAPMQPADMGEFDRDAEFFFDRIYWINGIFFACGEIPLGRRPFYPVNPV